MSRLSNYYSTIMESHVHIQKVFIPKKGMGFVARHDIPKHTIVLIDESIISLIRFGEDNHTDTNLIVIYLLMMLDNSKIKRFEELTPHSQDTYFSNIDIKNTIKNCENFKIKSFLQKQDIGKIALYLEKYKRNGFNLNNSHDIMKPGILLNGAIFNHSCDPNISFTCSNGKMYFFTNRDVTKGEELCDSYIDVSIEYKERQKILLERYGFICECEKCLLKKNVSCRRFAELKKYKTIDIDILHVCRQK